MTTIKAKGIFKGVVDMRRGIEGGKGVFKVELKCSGIREWRTGNLIQTIWIELL